jgi:beta-N-acetylhexosaminidase
MSISFENSPLVIGIEGISLKNSDRARLKINKKSKNSLVGGVILFSRNYESPDQLKVLTAEIKKENPDLVIMVDQEGGRVMRFKEGFSEIPPAKFFGDLVDSRGIEIACLEARKFGNLMATELLACGVDLSLSPVVDLGINQEIIGTRAFHRDPEILILLARAWMNGMNQAGMKTVIKHFPGHGSVKGDTHVSYLTDSRDFSEIDKTDLLPFKALTSETAGIMANHVIYSSVDDKPASFSSYWLKNILRKKLGFKGIILSDDLGMQAAKLLDHSPDKNSPDKNGQDKFDAPIKLALTAGCDGVLLCNEFDLIDRVLACESFASWLSQEPALSIKNLQNLKFKN